MPPSEKRTNSPELFRPGGVDSREDMMDESDIELRQDRALWDLLGRARPVEASPFFARKVLRAIEEAPAPVPFWVRWMRMAVPVGACAALAIAVLAGLQGSQPGTVVSSDPGLEFDTIENLDLLVANYESSLWLNASVSSPAF